MVTSHCNPATAEAIGNESKSGLLLYFPDSVSKWSIAPRRITMIIPRATNDGMWAMLMLPKTTALGVILDVARERIQSYVNASYKGVRVGAKYLSVDQERVRCLDL